MAGVDLAVVLDKLSSRLPRNNAKSIGNIKVMSRANGHPGKISEHELIEVGFRCALYLVAVGPERGRQGRR